MFDSRIWYLILAAGMTNKTRAFALLMISRASVHREDGRPSSPTAPHFDHLLVTDQPALAPSLMAKPESVSLTHRPLPPPTHA